MSKVSNAQINALCSEALANSARFNTPIGINLDQIEIKYIIYLYLIGYMSKDTTIIDGILYSATTFHQIPAPKSNQIVANAIYNINLDRLISDDEITPAPSDTGRLKPIKIRPVKSIQDVLYNLSLHVQYSKSKTKHYDLGFIQSMFTLIPKCSISTSEDIDDLAQIYLLSILAIKFQKCIYLDEIRDNIYRNTKIELKTIQYMIKTKELLHEIDDVFQPIFQKHPDIPDFLKSSSQSELIAITKESDV